MPYRYSPKFILKLILIFSIIFQFQINQSMEVLATAAAPSAIPIILPAIALALTCKLLYDTSNPIGKMNDNLNDELLNGTHSKGSPVNVTTKPKRIFFSDRGTKTRLDQFMDDFTEKQAVVLTKTYNPNTECTNIANLEIDAYTPITKTIFDSKLVQEQSSIKHDQVDKSEKTAPKHSRSRANVEKLNEILQQKLFPISKQQDGSLTMPIPKSDTLGQKIHDLELSRSHTQNIIASNSVNAGIMIYKLGAFLKQTYKSIQTKKFNDQQFDESLKNNPIAHASYQNAIKEAWLLFLKSNAENIPVYRRIQALLDLNKVYMPGKKGRLILELVRHFNALYFINEGILKLAGSKPKSEDLTKFLELLLRIISSNPQEAQSYIDLSKHYQIQGFEENVTNIIVENFEPVQENDFSKILKRIVPRSNSQTIDQTAILKNKINTIFDQILNACDLHLSNPEYNPYQPINISYLMVQKLKNRSSKNELFAKFLNDNYLIPLNTFLADRSMLFDDFNMLKIFGSDPVYIDLPDKEQLLLDESYRDKMFASLRDRYNAVFKIMQNLNLSNISAQTQTFLYGYLDKPITLNDLLKEICNPNTDNQILADTCNAKGILKAFEERAYEFPQLSAMPSCLDHPSVLKLLNRYLMFYPTKNLKPFFEEGLNYLINSIDVDGHINFQYLNLAKAYYTLINNADDRSVLMTSDSLTAGLSDFSCKYCVELNNNYLNELSYILRFAAKKLKTETDPYKKDLARFLVYAIRQLNQYSYSTNNEQIDSIIKYLKTTLEEPVETVEFLSTFTHMIEEVKTSESEAQKLFIGPKLHKKAHKQTSTFITKTLELVHQRAEVNNFYKQLHGTKHPEFYNQLDYVSNLCSSVLHKAETVLDGEALEIAKIAESLSFKANEFTLHLIPEEIAKTNYIVKTTLDPLIIECQEYLKPFHCDNPEVIIPTKASCIPEKIAETTEECGTGRMEEKTSFNSLCAPFADYEKHILPCGTGQKVEPAIVVLPCNHSRMQGMISFGPSKNPNTEQAQSDENANQTKSGDKEQVNEGEKEEPSSDRTENIDEQDASITQPINPTKPKKAKSGKLTQEIANREIEKINTKRNKQILGICREFIVQLIKAKLLTDSNEYRASYEKLINKFAARLKEIHDNANAEIARLNTTVQLHSTPKELENVNNIRKIKESLEIFNGSNLPKSYRQILEHIQQLLDYWSNRPEALQKDGPIDRILSANQRSYNRVQGALYALQKAYFLERLGFRVIAFDKEFLIVESTRQLCGTDRKIIEFDIELEDRFIEVKDIRWNFVEDFYAALNISGELDWLKDLDKVITFDLDEVDKTAFNDNLIKDPISEMKEFLQQIKIGNETAKNLGKKYEFYSKHAIPPAIKEWLNKNKVNFFEKECENCNCHKKYYSWCTLQ